MIRSKHRRKLNNNKRPQTTEFDSSSVLLLFLFLFVAVSGTSNVCHASADCPLNAICEPRTGWDGQCVCRPGYFMRSSGKQRACIQIADFGELCYLDQQCTFRLGLHSECQNGQCGCKDGSHYVVNENACFKSSSKSNGWTHCHLKFVDWKLNLISLESSLSYINKFQDYNFQMTPQKLHPTIYTENSFLPQKSATIVG